MTFTVGELKKTLEQYEDDVEVCVDSGDDTYEVMSAYQDHTRGDEMGLFLTTGAALPPL